MRVLNATNSIRHRVSGFLRNLNGVNKDQIIVNQTYNIAPSTDFFFSCKILVGPLADYSSDPILMSRAQNDADGYNMRIDQFGRLLFRFKGGVGALTYSDLVADFEGEVVDIRCQYRINGDKQIYVNNILKSTTNTIDVPDDSISPFNIGSLNGLFNFFTGKIYEFNINGELWDCNEGTGFNVTGSFGTIGVGDTINAGGLTYWNANVITPL